MEQYGNTTTYNVETVLRKNIVDSEYYRDTCMKLTSWEEVVDQIYYDVQHVEPWMSGNARGPSSAFCLLYRLFSLKVTEQEVSGLVNHTDSPYIRAVGFLYLRYVGTPRTLWKWVRPFVSDDEEISPSPGGKSVSMGAYVRDVFLEQYYFETIFPRIPKPVQDEFVAQLTSMALPTKAVGNGGQGGPDRRGIDEPNRRPASVKASLSVAMGQRAPNRATAREEGRGLGSSLQLRDSRPSPPPRKRPRSRSRERDERDRRDRGRDDDRDRGKYDRQRDGDRDRTRDRDDRDRRRDGDRGRDRDYGRDRR